MSDQHQRGACFCGQIAAQMCGDPFWICYDHDGDCRRAIGSASVVWVGYRPGQFQILQGQPKSFSKTRGVHRTFCGNCGTSISYRDERLPEEIYITLGFLDNPERFAPQAHAFWREKLPWMSFADDLPRLDGYSRSRNPTSGTSS